ncbi:hypothetical protein CYY_006045 [Polysphondylium violaceum]|uniref:Uncharacterized protein n=1 Tax=Polysphondylium violaceum TaxID=133409 RepID=A0A8J4UZ84_9MYCE|nr:hypothetical protein CYY_006045 [Polysphondylium violaceum]
MEPSNSSFILADNERLQKENWEYKKAGCANKDHIALAAQAQQQQQTIQDLENKLQHYKNNMVAVHEKCHFIENRLGSKIDRDLFKVLHELLFVTRVENIESHQAFHGLSEDQIPTLVKDRQRVGSIFAVYYTDTTQTTIVVDVAGESLDTEPRGLEFFVDVNNNWISRMYNTGSGCHDVGIKFKYLGKIENVYHVDNPFGWAQGLNQVVLGKWKNEFINTQNTTPEHDFCKFIVGKFNLKYE